MAFRPTDRGNMPSSSTDRQQHRDTKDISIYISQLLRHRLDFYDRYLKVQPTDSEDERRWKLNGFVFIDDLIRYRGHYKGRTDLTERQYAVITPDFIRDMVDNQLEKTGKIRTELSEDRNRIRALQGHRNGIRLQYGKIPAPKFAFHLTNETALEKIIGERQGIHLMGRDHVHMYKQLPTTLNPHDRKRTTILQINFPKDFECYDPGINNYIFSIVPSPAECIERKCTVKEYIANGYHFP
jgi:hypothetical protein